MSRGGAPLRIEMMLPSLPPAGMEVLVAALSRALVADGHAVGVTCLDEEGALAEGLRRDGVRVSVVPAPGIRPNFLARELAPWLRAQAPDVVHVHSGVWLKAVRAARAARVPRVLFTAHGLKDHEGLVDRAFMRLAGGLTDRVVAVSEPMRDFLVRRIGLPAPRVTVLPNGVDTAVFSPAIAGGAFRRTLGLAGDAPLIGIVARLAPVKNHQLLLEAFARVRARRPDAALALVGDGPLRGALEAQAASLGLAGAVHFCGIAAEPAACYRDLDVFVLSSLAEGTSVSLLEAMASGRAAVATAVGGNPHLLDHGRVGVLVPSGDADALAAALLGLLDDPARRAALGAAARARVEATYSFARMYEGYLRLYRDPAADLAVPSTPTRDPACAA